MAELADAHGSGPCVRKGVRVRLPLAANTSNETLTFNYFF